MKCLSQIICRINKDIQNCKESKIKFMTSQFFQLGQESYNQYLKLCSYASKEKFAQIYYKLIYKLIVMISKRLQGLNGLKLSFQLTVVIVHRVEQDKHFNKILAQILLSSFNPGDCNGFYQAKLNELQYKSFCSCCNKITNQIAYTFSSCLTIKFGISETIKLGIKCNNYFHNIQ